jgi:CDP-glucose 4,6-dehydratase
VTNVLRSDFWQRKRVLVTGHTGFKGGWLATWLSEMGAQVLGYALKPEAEPSFYSQCGLGSRIESVFGDVRHMDDLRHASRRFEPEVVFHLAGQPIVRRSYRDPVETFGTNVMGTVSVLEAVRSTPSIRAVVIVTSDKCYENREWLWGYREAEALGGRDPYSASKACAELVTIAYLRSYFGGAERSVGVATVRAGNVIGGGDWAEDRLVPDAVRAVQRDEALVLRSPESIRPWQHVLEPLAGYLMLAERLHGDGPNWSGAWNFGPRDEDVVTVAALVELVFKHLGKGRWVTTSEPWAPHEAGCLKLDCSKACHVLGWRPRLTLEEAVRLTAIWYRRAAALTDSDMYCLTQEQIRNYEGRLHR